MDAFEFTVAHDLGIGIVGFQSAEQGNEGCALGRSPGVGFMTLLVESSFVADTDAVGIVMTGMHADLTLITGLEYLSILLNVIVITNAFAMETGVVTGFEHFNSETLVAAGRRTMNYIIKFIFLIISKFRFGTTRGRRTGQPVYRRWW